MKQTVSNAFLAGLTRLTWAGALAIAAVCVASAEEVLFGPSSVEFSLAGEDLPCPHFSPVVTTTDTGIVAVWSQYTRIVGRFLEPGLGELFQVAESDEPLNVETLRSPAVTALPGSRFAVAWARISTTGDAELRVRFFDSQGFAETPELTVARRSSSQIARVNLTALQDGTVLVAWIQAEIPGIEASVLFRIVRQDGSFAGAETVVGESAVQPTYFDVDVASRPEGDFFLVWGFPGPDGASGVRGRAFSGSGTPASDVLEVTPAEENRKLGVAVAALSGGGYLVGWSGTQNTGGIWVRRWSSEGGLEDARQVSDDLDVSEPRLLGNRSGQVAVGYLRDFPVRNRTPLALLRLLDEQGTPISEEVGVVDAEVALTLDLAWDPAGQLLAVWQVFHESVIIPELCNIGRDARGRYFWIGSPWVAEIPTLRRASLALYAFLLLVVGWLLLGRFTR